MKNFLKNSADRDFYDIVKKLLIKNCLRPSKINFDDNSNLYDEIIYSTILFIICDYYQKSDYNVFLHSRKDLLFSFKRKTKKSFVKWIFLTLDYFATKKHILIFKKNSILKEWVLNNNLNLLETLRINLDDYEKFETMVEINCKIINFILANPIKMYDRVLELTQKIADLKNLLHYFFKKSNNLIFLVYIQNWKQFKQKKKTLNP